MLPVEAGDMAFADFGAPSRVSKRHYPSPGSDGDDPAESAGDLKAWDGREKVERETGLEPATLSLGSFRGNWATPCPA